MTAMHLRWSRPRGPRVRESPEYAVAARACRYRCAPCVGRASGVLVRTSGPTRGAARHRRVAPHGGPCGRDPECAGVCGDGADDPSCAHGAHGGQRFGAYCGGTGSAHGGGAGRRASGQFAPWSRSARQLWITQSVECAGCNWRCPFETPRCITEIPPEIVADGIHRALAVRCGSE